MVTYQPSFFFPYQSHTITCFSYVWDILRYDFYPHESDYKYYLTTDLYIGWQFISQWSQSNVCIELALFGGLAIVCYYTLAFLLYSFQHFIHSKQMMRHLYGQNDEDEKRQDGKCFNENPGNDIEKHRDNFRERLDAHSEFEFGYLEYFCSAIIVKLLNRCCCCLKKCCNKNSGC